MKYIKKKDFPVQDTLRCTFFDIQLACNIQSTSNIQSPQIFNLILRKDEKQKDKTIIFFSLLTGLEKF